MPTMNRLGITVAVVTLIACIAVYGMYWGIRKVFFSSTPSTQEELISPKPSPANTDNFSLDTDQDDLPDLVENVYLTNANKADTDGDGTPDGQEIALGRDPLKAGPDDMLKDIPTGAAVVATDTYTAKYLSTLPVDLPRNEVLNKERIAAFIEQQKGSLLPSVAPEKILSNTETGKKAVENYLNGISSSHNPAIKAVSSTQIDEAYRTYYASPTTSTALKDVRVTLEQNVVALQKVSSPAETLDIHRRLVAASQALIDNVKLLEDMPNDFVGGLIGAKKIEELGSVFQSIGADIAALEKKYKL